MACSIALLEAQRALSLEDEVRKYVPELNGLNETVRVHHLVHHTSGIRDKYALALIGGLPEESYSTDDGTLRLLAGQRTLNFPPGTRHMYSNSGYFLLAQMVERVSGEPFHEFTQKRIFGPAGMNDTMFRPDPGTIIPKRASGYQRQNENEWKLSEYTWQSLGPGGVFTTVGDLAKWDRALYGGILEPSNLHELMLRTHPLSNGKPNNYAFGLTLGKHRGLATVSHGGGVSGYSAEFLRYPNQRLTVICLANTSAAGAQMKARQVAELYLADHMDSQPDSGGDSDDGRPNIELENRFAGLYLSEEETSLLEVRVEGEAASIRAGGQDYPLKPVASNRANSAMGFQVLFEDDAFTLSSPGSEEEGQSYLRVAPTTPKEELGEIVGVYRSEELARDIEIKNESEGWSIARDLEKPQALKHLAADLFVWPVKALSMEFEVPVAVVRDTEGKPSALRISTDRALGVLFHKR